MSNNIVKINNWIGGKECGPTNGFWAEKYNPHSGDVLNYFADSNNVDVNNAVESAAKAFKIWSDFTPVRRGQVLSDIVDEMKLERIALAECIAVETGKPINDAIAEVNAAILQAEYFSGEGMRLYSKTLTSGMPGKYTHSVRQSLGIAALIVPANTPIANIAWKTFPALICGNSVVLKASEDSPAISILFAQLTKRAGLPDGVFNVLQGFGKSTGALLVENPKIAVISFTGSTSVGRWIAEMAAKRLTRVSLELGGKNPFIVCDDADLDEAVRWAILSAFSNAGQRCAAGSRILIFRPVFEVFKEKFIKKVKTLKLGINEDCDLGPVINRRQQTNILDAIQTAKNEGGIILCGGSSPNNNLSSGYYILPTVIDNLSRSAELSIKEIFGPVASLYIVENIEDALEFTNSSEYGLTAAIHTQNIDRAIWFAHRAKAGVVNINIGTFGSEPHMPFGGFGASGNGTREPGVEALDVYSELKCISILVSEKKINL